ncbi:MAG: hypothetical protein JSU01_02705 [Bacteroidetes bacterium]|nr:hypothetical protein [Bacteroidota bacterium]
MDKLFQLIKDNSALFIAIASATGYLSAYEFEIGQCSVYNIPENFIEIDLQNILAFTSIIIFSLLTTIGFIHFTLKIMANEPLSIAYPCNPTQRFISLILSIVVFVAMIMSSLSLYRDIVKYILIGSAIAWLLNIWWTGLYNMKKGVIPAHYKIAPHRILKVLAVPYFIIIAPILVKSMESYGAFKASQRVEFPTVNSKGSLVILKQYGQKLYCKKFDSKVFKLKDSLFILNIAQNPAIQLSIKQVRIKQ